MDLSNCIDQNGIANLLQLRKLFVSNCLEITNINYLTNLVEFWTEPESGINQAGIINLPQITILVVI
jgi:hypothetical protein